ncbi:claudin-20-like isoform X1 [Centroberyx affinis]|uniref:claudin-20-like isoform X1 n=1 Tax=Centroberyx affinis TaxID=166261 RepID=UPI003A5C5089
MLSSAVQILAFALALLGVLGATVATLLPNWKVSADVGSNIMTAMSQMQGLWMDCTWYSTGVFSCTLKYSVLSLPAYLQTARTAMVLSCMTASLGLCLASLGLKCTRWGGSHRAKGHTAIAAGGCFVLASVLCLVPASWFTNEVITSFLDANVPESGKYEPGGAVYVTFISAGFLLAGGVIFCLSCPGKRTGQLDYASSSTDPDKLVQQRRRQEKLHREQLEQEEEERRRRRREEKEEEEEERERPKNSQSKTVQLQTDDVEQEKPPQDKPQQDQEQQQYYSPSKLPPKDIKAGYSLQDYV